MSHLVEVDELVVDRSGQRILDGISLTVERNSIHAIIGPNGAGKSTLLKCLLGSIPYRGTIRLAFEGNGVIGYVPQQLAVDQELPLTVADFLRLNFSDRALFLSSSKRQRRLVDSALGRVGASHLRSRTMATLSGGELRRVLIGQALIPEPELLLLDEPTANLDDLAQHTLEQLLQTLGKDHQVTSVMVLHDLRMVDRCVDGVTALTATGQRVTDGQPALAPRTMTDGPQQ